jgi:hypothetical protein
MIPKAKHLVLLVGSNPLPNAVASQLLVEAGGVVSLVHSQGTARIANNLKNWIEARRGSENLQIYLKQVDESTPFSIYDGVKQILNKVNHSSVGLNYTGGTKVMSVHAYRAVQEWAEEKEASSVFSYLDARTLKMMFEDSEMEMRPEQRIPVGLAVQLTIDDLLALHGWQRKSLCRGSFLPKSAFVLAQVFADPNRINEWKEWICKELRSKAKRNDRREKWKSKSDLEKVQIEFPQSDYFSEFRQVIRIELGIPEETDTVQLAKATLKGELEQFCRWLDGIWLEDYVFESVRSLKQDLSINDSAQSVKTKEPEFEIDVVAVRGYQLFVFSCSTDDEKGRLKLKLFEAYVRARQLGGDEARVALVCLSDEPHNLEREMQRDFAAEGQIKVFGQTHIKDLGNHIRDWILRQGGGE